MTSALLPPPPPPPPLLPLPLPLPLIPLPLLPLPLRCHYRAYNGTSSVHRYPSSVSIPLLSRAPTYNDVRVCSFQWQGGDPATTQPARTSALLPGRRTVRALESNILDTIRCCHLLVGVPNLRLGLSTGWRPQRAALRASRARLPKSPSVRSHCLLLRCGASVCHPPPSSGRSFSQKWERISED